MSYQKFLYMCHVNGDELCTWKEKTKDQKTEEELKIQKNNW